MIEKEGAREKEEKGLSRRAIIPPSSIDPKENKGVFITRPSSRTFIVEDPSVIWTSPVEENVYDTAERGRVSNRNKSNTVKTAFMPIYRSNTPEKCQKNLQTTYKTQ